MIVRYIFDYRSVYSYLASSQLPSLGVPVEYVPVDILQTMAIVNNQPSPACPAKSKYSAIDAARWAEIYRLPMQPNGAYFAATRTHAADGRDLVSGALVAQDLGVFERYHEAAFKAVWGEPADLASDEGLEQLLIANDIHCPDFWQRARSPAIRERLSAQSKQAAAAGVFGVPTIFVDDEIFFGNDRLDIIRARLAQRDGQAMR
jgi:2-hydroxychromene-2-carboxylate isomerase